jgi:hypothetical protein
MMEFVSWDDEIPNIWKNVPNHQSETVSIIRPSHLDDTYECCYSFLGKDDGKNKQVCQGSGISNKMPHIFQFKLRRVHWQSIWVWLKPIRWWTLIAGHWNVEHHKYRDNTYYIYILIYCIDMLWYVKILTLLTNDYLDMGHNFDGMDHFGLRHEWHTSDSYLAARSPSAVAPGTWRVLLWIGIQCMPEYKNLGKLRCSNWLLTNLAVVIDPNQLITNQFGSGSSNSNQLQWGR